MPLQNRVHPDGSLHAVPERGGLFGNRGGRFHREDQTLGRSRWKSRAWIACRLRFKGRQREVWGRGYTELFFLDEATALAAGHRPCFECRRADAVAFAEAWGPGRTRAPVMDKVLQEQRVAPARTACADCLPDGTMVSDGRVLLLWGDAAYPWSFGGYGAPVPRPTGTVTRLTPAAVVRVLAAGYRPGVALP